MNDKKNNAILIVKVESHYAEPNNSEYSVKPVMKDAKPNNYDAVKPVKKTWGEERRASCAIS